MTPPLFLPCAARARTGPIPCTLGAEGLDRVASAHRGRPVQARSGQSSPPVRAWSTHPVLPLAGPRPSETRPSYRQHIQVWRSVEDFRAACAKLGVITHQGLGSVQRPVSSVQRPASSVQRPASSVQRPAAPTIPRFIRDMNSDTTICRFRSYVWVWVWGWDGTGMGMGMGMGMVRSPLA
ncbi:hypothetical protein B7494_g7587 [Chlorociboria aeruginascens]|nr:hypothetical protein B7494_g7587 [Chlorociboria aeruginascens]